MERILTARTDSNIKFHDLRRLLLRYGFSKWIHGSHYIFTKEDIPEIIILEPLKDGYAKQYQVKQIRDLFLKYKFHPKED